LAGNGTLVYAFFKQRSLRTLPNTLIISLSVGDLLTICGALPFVSTIYTVDSWPYGEMVCKLSELLRDLSSGVSVYTLALLSLDRYMAIVRPLRRYAAARSRRRRRRTLASVASVWAVSMAFAAPGFINSHLLRISVAPGRHILVCYPFPPRLGPTYARTIVMLKFLGLYLLPLLVISGFYAAMARHLLASAAQLRTAHRQSGSGTNSQVRSRVKVAKIVLTFILIFALCFFPSHVFLLWFYFYPDAYHHYNHFWHLLRIVGFVLTFTSSCLNPIALYFVSGVFRKHFQRYLCGFVCFVFCCARLMSDKRTNSTVEQRGFTDQAGFSSTRHDRTGGKSDEEEDEDEEDDEEAFDDEDDEDDLDDEGDSKVARSARTALSVIPDTRNGVTARPEDAERVAKRTSKRRTRRKTNKSLDDEVMDDCCGCPCLPRSGKQRSHQLFRMTGLQVKGRSRSAMTGLRHKTNKGRTRGRQSTRRSNTTIGSSLTESIAGSSDGSHDRPLNALVSNGGRSIVLSLPWSGK
jgi:bombesin-like receptor 3